MVDGASRMLVLFYFDQLGYSPFQLATLFLLYEFFGIVTNLVGGWVAARFGLKTTLFMGLSVQICAQSMLGFAPEAWLVVAYVMASQALSGIAKDLTKMSSKSAVKLVVPEGQEGDALQVGRDPDRVKERPEGRRLLPGGSAPDRGRLPDRRADPRAHGRDRAGQRLRS